MNVKEGNLLQVTDSYNNITKSLCFGKYDLQPQNFFMSYILIKKPRNTKLDSVASKGKEEGRRWQRTP